jgi:hypothetical protein
MSIMNPLGLQVQGQVWNNQESKLRKVDSSVDTESPIQSWSPKRTQIQDP